MQPVLAAYATDCLTGDQDEHNYEIFERPFVITGVVGIVDVVPQRPCTGADATHFDHPLVLTTIQYNAYEDYPIVHLGYGQCGYVPNCTAYGSGLHFLYTEFDSYQGELHLADGWYGGTPVVGHRYRFKITSIVEMGNPKWRYCIRDMTTGQAYVCHNRPRTWGRDYGTYVWWGAETKNDHSQIGGGGALELTEYQAQFEYQGEWWWVDTWDPVDPSHGCHKYSYLADGSQGTFPSSYYRCYVVDKTDTNGDGQLNDDDALNIYTISH
ncbi:MAG: hypothetical protein ABI725_00705 [Chloroflexota bacterium]